VATVVGVVLFVGVNCGCLCSPVENVWNQSRVQLYRLGDRGAAVAQLRAALRSAGIDLPAEPHDVFDDDVDLAVREFQQRRGLRVDGIVGPDTTRGLDEARRRLGDRLLYYSINHPFSGDDVAALQHRLIDMGFDAGRCDGIFGPRTESALRDFQRNRGLAADGRCGPGTLSELDRLVRTVSGGHSHELREAEALRRRGPALAGKSVVVDAAHGGGDDGWAVEGISERLIVADLASRLEGRLLAAGVAACLTHGPAENPDEQERARRANDFEADLLISLHVDGAPSPACEGAATFYFGTPRAGGSVVGERFADLVQREVVSRTNLRDLRTHPKTWELLRRTRMPAVRLELGYLTNPRDRGQLTSADFRDTVAEAVLAAVQRLFLPPDLDPPTGQLRIPALPG
jgi:N-acetylmuramoyl-L-alanine amidase